AQTESTLALEVSLIEVITGPDHQPLPQVCNSLSLVGVPIFATESKAVINGGPTNDLLWGKLHTSIWGNDGDDCIVGGSGNNYLWGGAGDDVIVGNEMDDHIEAGEGNDFIYGGNGADTLYGGSGDDLLHGNEGADELFGGPDDDLLY